MAIASSKSNAVKEANKLLAQLRHPKGWWRKVYEWQGVWHWHLELADVFLSPCGHETKYWARGVDSMTTPGHLDPNEAIQDIANQYRDKANEYSRVYNSLVS